MKIYTNDGNPLGLKLLMLTKLAKQDVTLEKVSFNDTVAKEFFVLPTLELDNGLQLFSTSAIAKYLFPNEGALRDQWLEWSTTLLAPALAHYMAVGHRANPNSLPMLNALVQKLEDHLKILPYLAGNQPTAADISVWCLLAPDGTLKGALSVDHLMLWHEKLSKLPEVQASLMELPLKDLTFSALQSSNRYGGLQHILLNVPIIANSANLLAENGTNLADTITDDELNLAQTAFVYTAAHERNESHIILPKAGERNVLITSALPYVNNVPHLGNIIGCVLSADIFARYCRMVGYNTLYICGTDEYGTATENKALAENMSPKEICDKYFELHNSIYRWFGIGFDYFGRTTHPEQTEVVQEAFKDVYNKGYIFTESVEQLLCQKCDRFLADRFVEGTCPHLGCGYEDARGDQCDKCGKLVNATELIRPRCKVCNTAPALRSSDQLFIDLPKIEPELREYLNQVESSWSNNARVITQAWLKEGLKPRCITRDLKWGIPVPHPGFEQKVFYVWFDAPFGYVSMTKRYTKEYRQWWQPGPDVNVQLFQFMAKDNVPFHSVMWPSALLAADKGYTKVSNLMATEYLNYEDGKFSKSRGIGVFGNDAQETGIPADVWRFYLSSARPESQDSSFSWNDLAARNNSELLNNLGNYVNRGLVFCEKNFNSIVPEMQLINDDMVLLALINRELRGYINSMEKGRLRDGCRHLLSISRQGNGYMQTQQPWVLLKGNTEQKARAGTIIGVCCNVVCLLANMLFPYMPTIARNIFKQLNAKQIQLNAEKPYATILLPAGHKIGIPTPLFFKLEQSFIDDLKNRYGGIQAKSIDNTVNSTVTLAANVSISHLEEVIKIQAHKVRQLKANTKNKALWQPEVDTLLDLKQQLAKAQESANVPKDVIYSPANELTVKQLEEAIQKQGDKVRHLKTTTKDKSIWHPEVEILLDLKNQLAKSSATYETSIKVPIVLPVDANKVKNLEDKIAKQCEKVRALKANSDSTVWKPEVDVLLDLKKELSNLIGTTQPIAQGKNKKK